MKQCDLLEGTATYYNFFFAKYVDLQPDFKLCLMRNKVICATMIVQQMKCLVFYIFIFFSYMTLRTTQPKVIKYFKFDQIYSYFNIA